MSAIDPLQTLDPVLASQLLRVGRRIFAKLKDEGCCACRGDSHHCGWRHLVSRLRLGRFTK